jgi:hypothetical protein
VIDNGRAINTFTPDVATNSDVYLQGRHYGVPGVVVNGQSLVDTLRTGRAVTDYVRANGPAIMQVSARTVHVCLCVYNKLYISDAYIARIVIYPGSSISLAQQCEPVRVLASLFTSCADHNSNCNNCNCDCTVVLTGAHLQVQRPLPSRSRA